MAMDHFTSSVHKGSLSDTVVAAETVVVETDMEDDRGIVRGVVELSVEEERKLLWKIDLQYVYYIQS